MKTKRILLTFLAVAVVIAALTAAVACTPKEPKPSEHTHTFSDEWEYDADSHWHKATCGDTTEVSDKAPHTLNDEGKCIYCPYQAVSHTVTFVADGETVQSLSFWEGTTVTEPQVPDKLGYTGVWENYTLGKSDLTVNAVYTAIEYDITFLYDRSVGEFADEDITKYTIEGLSLHTFYSADKTHTASWQDQNGTIYTNAIPEGTTGDLVLTAVWKLYYDFSENSHHTWAANGKCTICGQLKEPYSETDGQTKPYTFDGDKLLFGMYPQSEVKDTAMRSYLLYEINYKMPTVDDLNGWTDYGYYIQGEIQSYMWYIDVAFRGDTYRGVYFTSYRPFYTVNHSGFVDDSSSKASNSYQDDNGYTIDEVYWFKFEPITWRILQQENGKALVMADLILDSQQYYHEKEVRTINGETVYPNNYKESDIRHWLNSTFYDAAFDELSKQLIITTEVDNSENSTTNSGHDSNPYVCENTLDNIFLLSYRDISNTNYGFDGADNRKLKTTAYAQCQGARTSNDSMDRGCGWWMTRSPYISAKHQWCIYSYGPINVNYNVYNSDGGVVPALQIQL